MREKEIIHHINLKNVLKRGEVLQNLLQYLYSASKLQKIKMMNYILVHQYLQSEINSQYCIQNKNDSAQNAMGT